MKKNVLIFVWLGCLLFSPQPSSAYIFETYYQDWSCFSYDSPSPCSICPPVCQLGWQSNTYLNLAFASFNFMESSPGELFGVSENQSQIEALISYVHLGGGKVKISFGGATTSYWFNNGNFYNVDFDALAANIGDAIALYGFDGIDFDIETSKTYVATDPYFVGNVLATLQKVRAIVGTSKIISLTVPGQGWSTYWEDLVKAAILPPNVPPYSQYSETLVNGVLVNTVDYINFMEYDISISPGYTYTSQIVYDIQQYHAWGIAYNRMQLGLMPGPDDATTPNFLSQSDIIGTGQPNTGLVNTVVKNYGLLGIMTWDLNRDYTGFDNMTQPVDGSTCNPNPPPSGCGMVISDAIINALGEPANLQVMGRVRGMSTKYPYTSEVFVQQDPPPHGVP